MDEGDSAERPQARQQGRMKGSQRAPVSAWMEKENVGGRVVDAGVVILRTAGCAHASGSPCTMCGYNIESRDDVSEDDLRAQFEKASDRLEGIAFLKVYTSGSFLDHREIPTGFAGDVLKWSADRGARLLVESRAEFVTDAAMEALVGVHDDLEVALGLESANDRVLRYAINKNMTVADYDRAATTVKKAGAALRSYVILKPPFLTEPEAVEDAIATVRHAALQSDAISVNPVNVQRNTLVERLWKTWAYRPPWLWSVVEVLNSSVSIERKIVCEPTGGGRERGAHNCGRCDGAILDSIRRWTISQDHAKIAIHDCECRQTWESVKELEGRVADGTVDLQRMFRRRA